MTGGQALYRSCVLALGLVAAAAAEVGAEPVEVTAIELSLEGFFAPITATGNSGTVDVTSEQVFVPARLIGFAGPLTIPVTGTSAVNSLVVSNLFNLSGTFSFEGVVAQAPSEICAPAGPAPRSACNAGGGIGGAMGLTGTIEIHVIRDIIVIPLTLGLKRVGQGGGGPRALSTDAALWSTGGGRVNTGAGTASRTGSSGLGSLNLVSPTFVDALGNLLPVFATFSFDVGIGSDDRDADGVPDVEDNCARIPNANQSDVDEDGTGDVCDGDFNQDGFVGGPDFDVFLGCFDRAVGPGSGPPDDPECAESDMNGDGFVGGPDFGLFLGVFNRPI